MQSIRKFLGWTAVAALLAFVLLNLTFVTINFWFVTEVRAPLAFVVLGSAAMGALALYMFKAARASQAKK